MSGLETIFQKNSTRTTVVDYLGFPVVQNTMSSKQFKSALTEVAKLVGVTDEEIEKYAFETYHRYEDARLNGPTQQSAKWSRDLSKTKLKKLIG